EVDARHDDDAVRCHQDRFERRAVLERADVHQGDPAQIGRAPAERGQPGPDVGGNLGCRLPDAQQPHAYLPLLWIPPDRLSATPRAVRSDRRKPSGCCRRSPWSNGLIDPFGPNVGFTRRGGTVHTYRRWSAGSVLCAGSGLRGGAAPGALGSCGSRSRTVSDDRPSVVGSCPRPRRGGSTCQVHVLYWAGSGVAAGAHVTRWVISRTTQLHST